MSKRKRNYYKFLFYILLLLVLSYIALQQRKKNSEDYVVVRVPKNRCPVTMIMKHNLLVIDKNGHSYSESEWFSKKNMAMLSKF
jgi:hypothetical protein